MSLYETLKINKKASKNDIRKAYRKRSKETHPDIGGNNDEFLEVQKAYKVLIEDNSRKQYDYHGTYDDPYKKTAQPSMDELMFSSLEGLLEAVINSGSEDILGDMKQVIPATIKDVKKEIAKLENKKKKLERFISRLSKKIKDEDDPFLGLTKFKLSFIEKEIEPLKIKQEVFENLKNFIDKYNDGFVKPKDPNTPRNPFMDILNNSFKVFTDAR
jgi:curved DNA-binding protein CbpA